MRPALLLAVLATLGACATPQRLGQPRSPLLAAPSGLLTPEGRAAPVPGLASHRGSAAPSVEGSALAATAREFVGQRTVSVAGKRFPDDCTGLVRAVYARHGVDLFAGGVADGTDNGVTAIWRYAEANGHLHRDRPRLGDIVFFTETYDRNRDGRENDGLTHVGVVERVDADGTVHVVHRVAGGVASYRMNLAQPRDRKDASGRVVNDWLRMGKKSRLAGELFAGYGSLSR